MNGYILKLIKSCIIIKTCALSVYEYKLKSLNICLSIMQLTNNYFNRHVKMIQFLIWLYVVDSYFS